MAPLLRKILAATRQDLLVEKLFTGSMNLAYPKQFLWHLYWQYIDCYKTGFVGGEAFYMEHEPGLPQTIFVAPLLAIY